MPKRIFLVGSAGGSAGTMVRASRIPEILVFGMFGLATFQHLPNFGKQGGKGGDFLSGFSQKILPGPCLEKSLFWLKEKSP